MKSIKVNADYEMVLFDNKKASKVINQSIEFLALYLEDSPLFSEKVYSKEFLTHVRKITGREPTIINRGDWENWWGELKDLPLEQTLNSKEFIIPFSSESQLITSIQEIAVSPDRNYLAKSPYGMSGQNFLSFSSKDQDKLGPFLARSRKLVVEPLYRRVKDFSHYVFSNGAQISYQNLVDKNFQYKGTIFHDLTCPDLQHLSFYEDINVEEWKIFEQELKKIVMAIRKAGGGSCFSIDSFTYLEEGRLKIRAACEVNYRKTMGLMAFLLSQKFFKELPWTLFILGKPLGRSDSFTYVQEKLRPLSGCLHLSPGDTRFEVFLIGAKSHEEGLQKFNQLQGLLPECQFSVKI